MADMVERVARALALAPDPLFRGDTEPSRRDAALLTGSDFDWERFIPAARAAIAAMRLTDAEFVNLCDKVAERLINIDPYENGWTVLDWNAMIDAAASP